MPSSSSETMCRSLFSVLWMMARWPRHQPRTGVPGLLRAEEESRASGGVVVVVLAAAGGATPGEHQATRGLGIFPRVIGDADSRCRHVRQLTGLALGGEWVGSIGAPVSCRYLGIAFTLHEAKHVCIFRSMFE